MPLCDSRTTASACCSGRRHDEPRFAIGVFGPEVDAVGGEADVLGLQAGQRASAEAAFGQQQQRAVMQPGEVARAEGGHPQQQRRCGQEFSMRRRGPAALAECGADPAPWWE